MCYGNQRAVSAQWTLTLWNDRFKSRGITLLFPSWISGVYQNWTLQYTRMPIIAQDVRHYAIITGCTVMYEELLCVMGWGIINPLISKGNITCCAWPCWTLRFNSVNVKILSMALPWPLTRCAQSNTFSLTFDRGLRGWVRLWITIVNKIKWMTESPQPSTESTRWIWHFQYSEWTQERPHWLEKGYWT